MKALLDAFLLSAPVQSWARAGGAGGGSSSSGGGGVGGDFSSGGGIPIGDIIFALINAGPFGWVVLLMLAFAAYWIWNAMDNGTKSGGIVSLPASASAANDARFSEAFPGEDLKAFREKVAKAFFTVEAAWSEQNLSRMRRFISDGVYQRFHAQFLMMKLLEQSNPLSDVKLYDVEIADVRHDGAYDCVDVAIQAGANDQFSCRKFPELDSPGGFEKFTEFWSFVRRGDCRPGKDIFRNEACPQCGAPLTEKLVETARCPYCGSHLNSGEFDWVLAEITQSDDYGSGIPLAGPATPADRGVPAVRRLDPGFSAQLLEDKATNAFMEILIGSATGQAALVKRFTTERAFAALEQRWPKAKVAYDRLYTRAVKLLAAEASGTTARAFVAVRYSAHLIDLSSATPRLGGDVGAALGTLARALEAANSQEAADAQAMFGTSVKVLAMTRDYSGGAPKGSVYAGTCPHCGAPQRDNLNPACDHCGQPLNDAHLDWVVDAVLDPTEYRQLREKSLAASG